MWWSYFYKICTILFRYNIKGPSLNHVLFFWEFIWDTVLYKICGQGTSGETWSFDDQGPETFQWLMGN